MRVLKDILLGLGSGILIVLLAGSFIPGARDIFRESFANAKTDLKQALGMETEENSGTDFTKLIAEGKKISGRFQGKDSGISGAGQTFDVSVYPYYGLLDENQQKLYAQLYANVENVSSSFVPSLSVNADQLEEVFEAVFYDHPELFWLDTGYTYQYTQNGVIAEVDLKYNETAADLDHARQAFQSAADQLLTGAQQYGDAESKERYVHDALIDQIDYDVNASLNQSAYSALVSHRTVCAGYAKAFQYLMIRLGIPAYYVTGTSENEDHAWNIVLINGRYVNVDLTWDDTSGEKYRFFNVSDGEMGSSHARTGLSRQLPACP